MGEDTGKRGKQKTHPVWNFLDFVRQGIKEAVYKCKLCGLEKEGISASRWTPHILGRAVGNATTAGIDSCSGGGEDKCMYTGIAPLCMYTGIAVFCPRP